MLEQHPDQAVGEGKKLQRIVAEVTENVRSSCKHSKHHHVHDQHQNIRSLQSCFQHTAAPTSQTELKHFGNLKSDVPKCLPSAISTRRAKSNQLNFPSNFPNTFLWSFPRSRLEGLPPLSGCSRNQPRLVKSKQNNNHFFHDAIDKTHISSRLANPIFRSSISLLFRCFFRNHHHIT